MKSNASGPENSQAPQKFESDTEKIIHRHLANKDDVITEEDIRNVRIGITPPEPAVADDEAPVDRVADDTNG
jgi:hypothetical protein